MIKFIDLFSGIGGIRLGFQQAMDDLGIKTECVFSSEIKPYAVKIYKNFFKDSVVFGDITKADTSKDIPDFDVLLAGFPCQAFSSAGKRDGFLDTRGTLFFEIERILKDKLKSASPPKAFLLENVEGLLNHDRGRTLDTILSRLKLLGYNVNYKLLDSKDFGLAQTRKRVYIVGTLNSRIDLDSFSCRSSVLQDVLEKGLSTLDSPFTRLLLKNYTPKEIIGKSIKDKRGGDQNIHSWDIGLKGKVSKKERELLNLLLKERRKKHWASMINIDWMDGMPLTKNQIKTFFNDVGLSSMLDRLVGLGYLVKEYPKKLVRDSTGKLRRIEDTDKEKGYNIVTGKLSFEFSKILDPSQISPTLVAMDVAKLGVVDGDGIRHLSIRECQRLCGYPDSFNLETVSKKEAYDLIGNTVCVPVIKDISSKIGSYFLQQEK